MMFGLFSGQSSSRKKRDEVFPVIGVDLPPSEWESLQSVERTYGRLIVESDLKRLACEMLRQPSGGSGAPASGEACRSERTIRFLPCREIIGFRAEEKAQIGAALTLNMLDGQSCYFIFTGPDKLRDLYFLIRELLHPLCLVLVPWEWFNSEPEMDLYRVPPRAGNRDQSHVTGRLVLGQAGLTFSALRKTDRGDRLLPDVKKKTDYPYREIVRLRLCLRGQLDRSWLEIGLRDGTTLHFTSSSLFSSHEARHFAEALDQRLPRRRLEVDYGNGFVRNPARASTPATVESAPAAPGVQAKGPEPQAVPAPPKPAAAPIGIKPGAPIAPTPAAPAPKAEKVCKFCGYRYPADEEFCPECGAIETV